MNNITPSTPDNGLQRRYLIQQHKDAHGVHDLNGIDYIEVNDSTPRILLVHLLGRAPDSLLKENIAISCGRRIRTIYAVDPAPHRCTLADDLEPDNCLRITLNQAGDFSLHTLRLVAVDAQGRPTDTPLQGFDQRYAQAEFSFKANTMSDVDCRSTTSSIPTTIQKEPEISYLAKDYASFRQRILDHLTLQMPGWQERHIPDIGITLIELLAYVGDHLSYYQDAVATEAYLTTARQRISVRRHARLVDYQMHEGCNARTWVYIETSQDVAFDPQDALFITTPERVPTSLSPMLTDDDLRTVSLHTVKQFAPLSFPCDPQGNIPLYEAHNSITFYTWGNQQRCLSRGATSATLLDEWVSGPITQPAAEQISVTQESDQTRKLHLKPGDVLY
jgi:hypothetical protein